MRIVLTLVSTFCITISAAGSSECGVVFSVPSGWTTRVLRNENGECAIGARPQRWKKIIDHSRWPEEPFAITVTVLDRPFKKAVAKLGFERDEQGHWGIPGRDHHFQAEAVRFGAFSGWRSESWFRGFAKDGAKLGLQSRLYSGNWVAYLLRDKKGVVAIQYSEWSPDVEVDRSAAARKIVKSLHRSAPN
jgi:hypothetical protein